MTSTLQKPVFPHTNSRPNSASGSSATTVQRTNSFTSRNGSAPRPVPTGLRPQGATDHPVIAPADLTKPSFSPDVKKKSPDQKRRSSALYTRPGGRHEGDEGVSNLNRWSQSTASSNQSHRRRSSFSKRLSGSLGTFGGFGGVPPAASPNSKARKRSPTRSVPAAQVPISPMPANPPPLLPPIAALSSLSQAVDDADSPSTMGVATPVTADVFSQPSSGVSQDPDYFGDRWKSGPPSSHPKRKAEMPSSRANPPAPLVFASPTSPGSKLPESVYSPRVAMRSKEERRRHQSAPKQRSRASTGASSKSNATNTTEGESSASDHREYHGRQAKRRAPSQKALLSKALAKANHAVVLDGKSNVEGAILAYGDACTLLRQVMIRSSGDDDRRKLEAVRNTYKNRIVELRNTDPNYQSSDGKALPERPAERDSQQPSERLSIVTDGENPENGAETTRSTNVGHDSGYGSVQHSYYADARPYIPPRRQSLQPFTRAEGREAGHADDAVQQYTRRPSNTDRGLNTPTYPAIPMYEGDIPPPLTPRRPLSPVAAEKEEGEENGDEMQDDPARKNEAEHTSWLNTIAESSGSDQDSVHSRRASYGVRRKYIRADNRVSGQTEAEFDAALDAAIETAYDDGFEPDDEDEGDEQVMEETAYPFSEPKPEILSNARRNVELAKQNVREAEREAAIAHAKQHERRRLQEIARLQEVARLQEAAQLQEAARQPDAIARKDSIDMEYGDDEAEEEERMLEEMTKDYVLDDDEHDGQRKSALPQPRQSGSSGFSGKTWTSSGGSNPTSAGTSLSTVAEASVLPSLAAQLEDNPLPPQVHPPPLGALPPPPEAPSPIVQQPDVVPPKAPGLAVRESSPSVRDRRLSGMKATQLRVETYPKRSTSDTDLSKTQPLQPPPPIPPPALPSEPVPEAPRSAFVVPEFQQTLSSATSRETLSNSATLPGTSTRPGSRKGSSPYPGWEADAATTSTLTKVTSQDSDASGPSVPSSPARFGTKATTGLRKNFSSSSLRNKSLSINTADQDASPNTSVSSVSSIPNKRIEISPAMPVMPTPLEASFLPKGLASSSGGIYLFDCDIHSPMSPGSPNPLSPNPPLPLEPCPESTLLRPFWLLRSIYQTIANPRGGYITSRLFVPRDIWRVKNIKLKNVEEKVSSCDLLTAALLKLNKVDPLNADAVLEEMQFLEGVMDQVQSNLSKKLGNDVGVQGAASSFKGITTHVIDDSASQSEALTNKTNNPNSKSYLSSWRKLRSKNSLGPGLTTVSATTLSKDGGKEAPTMKSLPMSTVPNPRFPKRDVSQVQCMGPNPSYMGALARLCDAAQVLDQITRDAQDPGLSRSSQTHVGLELSARHAAEFFAFYICRFVFADIGLMLDKFIKRGSEWVLA